jgi:hypothetical protein
MANDHMRRDMETQGKWACACEACQSIRSLIGMEKILDIRPVIREVQRLEGRLQGVPDDGAERRNLMKRYLQLYDELAELVAK